ncbi:MAG: hypothetical protein ACFBSE_07500 [Prochloraceae cyanobacterium]
MIFQVNFRCDSPVKWVDRCGWKKVSSGVYVLVSEEIVNPHQSTVAINQPETKTTTKIAESEDNNSLQPQQNSQLEQLDLSCADLIEQKQDRNEHQDKTRSNQIQAIKNLPLSPQLKHYGSIVETIFACLKEFAPAPMTASKILDWLYPEGLEKEIRKKAYTSITSCLSSHVGKKWVRVKLGFYALKSKQAI